MYIYSFSGTRQKQRVMKKRVKVNKTLSLWKEVLCGVPQESVLGSILFIKYLKTFFLFLNDIDVCNFADDTTSFVYHKNLAELLEKLERNSEIHIHWFEDNYIKLNTDKCHLLIPGHKHEHQGTQIGTDIV